MESTLTRRFTGLVVESLAAAQDFGRGTLGEVDVLDYSPTAAGY